MIDTRHLATDSIRALKWNYIGVLAKALLQVSAGVILARILGPEHFGAFAATLIVTSIINILSELGIGSALVRKQSIDEADVRVAFTAVMTAGTLFSCSLLVGGDYLARAYEQPHIASLLQASAASTWFQTFGVVSISLLRRQLAQKPIQIAQLVSYILGYLGIGLALALANYGAWSLVIAVAAQALLQSAILYGLVRHPIVPLLRWRDGFYWSFGSKAVLSNLVNWFIDNIPNVLLGRLFGLSALGAYSLSYNLVRTPVNQLVASLQSVIFAASARAELDNETLGRIYVGCSGALAILLMPVFFSIAAVAPTVVEGLYGLRWATAAPMLVPLSLAMPLHALMAIAGPFLWGKGFVGHELRVQALIAMLLLILIGGAIPFGAVALTWALLGLYLLRAVWMSQALLTATQTPSRVFWGALRGGIIFGFALATALWTGDQFMTMQGIPAGIRLVLDVALGMGLMGIGLFLFTPRLASPDTLWLAQRIMGKIHVTWPAWCVQPTTRA